MKTNTDNIQIGNLCPIHDNSWLEKQRVAGKVAAKTITLLSTLVKEKATKSLLELDKIAEEFIINNGCKPTFKNYKGFPASVCMSVDNEKSHALVHGIPDNYKLQDGDLITFDLGATYEGAIGDTAVTCIYGSPKNEGHIALINDTNEALYKAIESIKVGSKIGVIGNTIYNFLSKNYSVITNYGGHSCNYDQPHCFPFISNKSSVNEGIRIQPGMTLCIEPMAVIGNSNRTWVGKDGWTVYSDNVSAQFEHTIFIHEDKVEIITNRD